jgi:hypothetical protein
MEHYVDDGCPKYGISEYSDDLVSEDVKHLVELLTERKWAGARVESLMIYLWGSKGEEVDFIVSRLKEIVPDVQSN